MAVRHEIGDGVPQHTSRDHQEQDRDEVVHERLDEIDHPQVESFVRSLLARRLPAEHAAELARLLSTGTWTHDHPLQVDTLKALGLPITVGVGAEERGRHDHRRLRGTREAEPAERLSPWR